MFVSKTARPVSDPGKPGLWGAREEKGSLAAASSQANQDSLRSLSDRAVFRPSNIPRKRKGTTDAQEQEKRARMGAEAGASGRWEGAAAGPAAG
ncbi:MAG: hypothetical protein LDL14_09090, partial [Nitrospira sp.]|nr:hypothetical protein [Nitrospira sp.]